MTTKLFKLPATMPPSVFDVAKKRKYIQKTYMFNRKRERFYNYHKVQRQTGVDLVNGIYYPVTQTEKISNECIRLKNIKDMQSLPSVSRAT